MAIYHFSVQAISRGKGQSAVASASYRSGEKLMDEQTGEAKFYKRDVQPETMILAPDNAPEWVKDRQRLWNEVEKIEKNKNSRLAREINVALPVELSHGQQKELIKNYAKEQFVDKGMVADIAIHRDDANNPHAHIMLTIRPFDEKGEWQKQKSKKEYILDEKGNFTYNKKGEKRTRKIDLIGWDKKELVQEWRKEWSHHANKMLEREGINERIDHRSHKERGLETLPTQHVGYVASAMEKKGIETERGNYNRDVQAYNETVVDLQKYREQKHELERSNEPTRENKVEYTPQEATQLESAAKFLNGNVSIEKIEMRLGSLDRFEKKLDKISNSIRQKDTDFRDIKESYSSISAFQKRLNTNAKTLKSIGVKGFISRSAKNQKESLLRENSQFESVIEKHQQKLVSYQEKYKFSNESEFKVLSQKHSAERPNLLEANQNQRRALRNERDVLGKAKSILEDKFIHKVASKYPNHPEMAYIKYKTAKAIDSVNKESGKVFSVQEFKDSLDHDNEKGKGSLGIFDGIVQGIEQAQRQMERQERKNKVNNRTRQKQKRNMLDIGELQM